MHFRTLILFTSAFAMVAEAATIKLSVEGAAARAVNSNPDLAAARYRIEEARGRLDGAGRLENPEIEFEFRQNPRMPERSFGATWTQKFPVTGRLKLEKAVSRAELAAAVAEVSNEERKTAGEAREAAISLLAITRERELRKQQIQNSAELAGFMAKRVQSGEGSAVDASQVDLETRQLDTQILQLDVKQATTLGALRPLLGLRAGDTVEVTGDLSEPESLPAKNTDPNQRGDYRASQASSEAARHGVQLAHANRWADIGVGLIAENERTEDVPEGFKNDTMLGFKVNVPLPLWNKNEGKIREAAATAKRAEKESQALALKISSEVDAARAEMAAQARIIEAIDGKLIPQAKQIEDQQRANFATGLTPLPEVIRARGRRFELEVQKLDALREYHLAKARYSTAVGATIKRK